MTNRLAKICPLLPFALILLLGTFPAFAQTAEAEEHTETGIKYLHLYDTEDEKAVFRAVYKGMATPVAVNTFELYGEDVSIALCNITEKNIKEMIMNLSSNSNRLRIYIFLNTHYINLEIIETKKKIAI